MTQPTPYYPTYNFTQYQASHPSTPLPAASLDSELFNIAASITEICDNLALIQRDDGALANNSVGYAQLAGELQIGIDTPTNWITATAYVPPQTVYENNNIYKCVTAHTSSVFATDLASGYWVILIDFSTPLNAAAASATSAAASQATASAAATSATASAATAQMYGGIGLDFITYFGGL